MPTIPAEKAALQIIERLRQAGHQALLAGGCVRDRLLGRPAKDYDVATDARPEQIISLFRRTRQVGVQFGVVQVKQGRSWVEVATFRSDHSYSDGRHPDAVQFTSAEEDAKRRDFTINGMFYDPVSDRVIDYVGGQQDLAAGVIRAIGDPAQRFREDHLRMLRAIRFATELGYRIDPATFEAVRQNADAITRVSAERIQEELAKTLAAPNRRGGFDQLARSGLLEHLWPNDEWDQARIERALAILGALRGEIRFSLGLAVLLLNREPAQVRQTCRDLRCSTPLSRQVVWLVTHHADLDRPDELALADLKTLMQSRQFDDLTELLRARLVAAGQDTEVHSRLISRASQIPPERVDPPPLVDGEDLKALGLPPGPRYKQILDAVRRAQLDERIHTRQEGTAMARQLVSQR
jgi:poly(A) polymerase